MPILNLEELKKLCDPNTHFEQDEDFIVPVRTALPDCLAEIERLHSKAVEENKRLTAEAILLRSSEENLRAEVGVVRDALEAARCHLEGVQDPKDEDLLLARIHTALDAGSEKAKLAQEVFHYAGNLVCYIDECYALSKLRELLRPGTGV